MEEMKPHFLDLEFLKFAYYLAFSCFSQHNLDNIYSFYPGFYSSQTFCQTFWCFPDWVWMLKLFALHSIFLPASSAALPSSLGFDNTICRMFLCCYAERYHELFAAIYFITFIRYTRHFWMLFKRLFLLLLSPTALNSFAGLQGLDSSPLFF